MQRIKMIILLSYICIASVSATLITPALVDMQRSFNLSNGAIEWVVSLFLLGYVIGQLIYGPLANRYGRLTALRIGLAINLLGIGLCLYAANNLDYPIMLAGRMLTALGAASGLGCTITLINETMSDNMAKKAMSYAVISFTLGIGIAVSIGGVVTEYWAWQACFVVLMIHGVLTMASTWFFNETLQVKQSINLSTIGKAYYEALRSPKLIAFSLCAGLCSAVAYCYSAAAPIYAQTNLHLSTSQYGYWNLINTLGMLGSGVLSAYLMKKHSATKLLLIALCLLALSIAALFLLNNIHTTNPVWFFINTSLLYLFGGMLFPAASYLASNSVQDKANAAGMMSFINMGSAMLAVIIMGYLPITNIISFALTLAAFLLLVLVLCWPYLIHSQQGCYGGSEVKTKAGAKC
jgi:DHA1 family bicyclomycin/chloramphenicol resistance-like MFS transporter